MFSTNRIVLRPEIEQPFVNLECVASAYHQLSLYSVDVLTSDDVYWMEFADKCILFAAIQFKTWEVSKKKEEREEAQDESSGSLFDDDGFKAVSDSADMSPDGASGGWLHRGAQHYEFPIHQVAASSAPAFHHNMHRTQVEETVGLIYVKSTSRQSEVSVGVALLPRWRQAGFATEALELVIPWLFDQLACHRVQAILMDCPSRDAALTIFTDFGFVLEGTHRRAVMNVELQVWQDVTYMGLLDTDWLLRRTQQCEKPTVWDSMFMRHQREREELLEWEERRCLLRRTSSSETIKTAGDAHIRTQFMDKSDASGKDGFVSDASGGQSSRMRINDNATDHSDESISDIILPGSPYLSDPPSRASSTFSWSGSESSVPETQASAKEGQMQGKRRGKRKGKRKVSQRPVDDSGGYTSKSSSGWSMVSIGAVR
ncbi:uncharacterized protein FIBRA_03103 [Fibroporia radiculosa]|uniref:N-acetyltransferase domain-containing protein n=1 Tax=Fibroporia radiculosa TaxID=599839 RepID=J4GNA6_9APHY|nr:uncharacterized protein FIBRA_03103 [Fibroporia radiculosa]CCM01055.1 predicted protein [Fibroporia radiculosa]